MNSIGGGGGICAVNTICDCVGNAPRRPRCIAPRSRRRCTVTNKRRRRLQCEKGADEVVTEGLVKRSCYILQLGRRCFNLRRRHSDQCCSLTNQRNNSSRHKKTWIYSKICKIMFDLMKSLNLFCHRRLCTSIGQNPFSWLVTLSTTYKRNIKWTNSPSKCTETNAPGIGGLHGRKSGLPSSRLPVNRLQIGFTPRSGRLLPTLTTIVASRPLAETHGEILIHVETEHIN